MAHRAEQHQFSLEEIREVLTGYDYQIRGNSQGIVIRNARTLQEADQYSLVWISPSRAIDAPELIANTAARCIVCKAPGDLPEDLLQKKCLILTDNPKLIFSLLLEAFFVDKPRGEVHPTAVVHPEADLAADVYVGPFTYVGKCRIDQGSIIWGNCYLYDNVTLGKNVEIHAGCVIGDEGSGYAKNEKGEWIKFPHIGGTILEDNVEVGANTYINRGALGNTHIKKGAKIGNSVCIGHNVVIEENAIVIANSLVAGSSHVGEGVYIAPSVTVRNRLTIGDNAFIGMGAVVVKDVPEDATVLGNPAEPIEEFRKWKRLKTKLFALFGEKKG